MERRSNGRRADGEGEDTSGRGRRSDSDETVDKTTDQVDIARDLVVRLPLLYSAAQPAT